MGQSTVTKQFFDISQSPQAPLLSPEEADKLAESLRAKLSRGCDPLVNSCASYRAGRGGTSVPLVSAVEDPGGEPLHDIRPRAASGSPATRAGLTRSATDCRVRKEPFCVQCPNGATSGPFFRTCPGNQC